MSTSAPATRRQTTLPRLLRSEWMKAATVHAPRWTSASILATAAFFASSVLLVIGLAPMDGEDPGRLIAKSFGDRPTLAVLAFVFTAVQALSALLGLLLVSGERGTGTLAVTLAAVPQRTPVLTAKLLLSAAAGLTLGLLAGLLTIAIVEPSVAGLGFDSRLWSIGAAQVLLGGAISSAVAAVLGTALGSLFRNTAGAAGAVMSLFLIAPVILPMIPVVGRPASQLLPSSAGAVLSQPMETTGAPTLITAAAILAGWVVTSSVVAAWLWRQRDV